MINILADENIPYVKTAFESLGKVTTLTGRNIKNEDLKQTDILLVRSVTKVNKNLLENTPVRFVASATAGFNHIDLNYLKQNNIGFARAPGSNAISAAEYVLAGICKWSLINDKPLHQLSIGIIGYGNVGTRVKKLCDDYGIKSIINDPPLQEETNNQPENAESVTKTKFADIDQALQCDIVTLHVPLSKDGKNPTLRLLNKHRIAQLKPGTLFINASRGEVVEEPALLERMQNNDDLTLILDVWENEPEINLQMLARTLVGTPHIAGYSIDGKIRGTEMIYQACCDYLGKKPQWSSENVDFGKNQKYDLKNSSYSDPREAILAAYDIMLDNEKLKVLFQDKPLNIGKYFDHLRKTYPPRREFSDLI